MAVFMRLLSKLMVQKYEIRCNRQREIALFSPFSPQSRTCQAVFRTSNRRLRDDESRCRSHCNDTPALQGFPFFLCPSCLSYINVYLTTRVNTGVSPSKTVTYTFISPIAGIAGAPSLGKSSAVNRYSVPLGRALEATAFALA